MDAKYQDLRITSINPYNEPSIIKRGIEISMIEFYENRITIIYYENDIKYEMTIPFDKLQRKSLIID